MSPRVGDTVGAQRWPQFGAHPSNWGAPHRGVLLDRRDARAWANTAAFPTDSPCPEAVSRWVDRMERECGFTTVPVLWDFGAQQVVYWESPKRVVHYMDDLSRWDSARNAALRRQQEIKGHAPATKQCAAIAA